MVGTLLGLDEGMFEEILEGMLDGILLEGIDEGIKLEGIDEGIELEGIDEGLKEGKDVGSKVGDCDVQ